MSENIAKYNILLELVTESKKANEGIGSVEKKVGGLGTLFKTAGLAFAGMFSVQAIQGVNSKIFDITKKYQQYATILKVATGSTQEASKSMKLIEDTAKGTTFSVDELTSSYIKFINRGIKPTKDEILAIADLAASQGKGFDQLTEAILDATTGEWERLKEFGIKATTEGDKVNLSFKGVNKTIEKTPEAIKQAIIEMGKMKGVAGSNAEQMNTLNGILSNMGDNAEKIWKNIGERLKDFYTNSLSGVAKMVEWLSKITEIPIEKKLEDERVSLNALVRSITDVNVSQEERTRLMTQLNEKYPYFLENIRNEKGLKDDLLITDDMLISNMQMYNKLFITRIALETKKKEIEEILTEAGEKKLKNATKEIELQEKLERTVKKYKLPVDLDKTRDLGKNLNAVIKELQNYFIVEDKGYTDIKAGASNTYKELATIRSKYYSNEDSLKRLNTEAEAEQDLYDKLEAKLGKYEDIIKFFEVKNPDKTETEEEKKKREQEEKRKKEREEWVKGEGKRQQKQLDELEKIYLQKELQAKKEITDAEVLSRKLQEIEYEKNLALLRLKQSFVDKNSKDYLEFENQIFDTETAFLDFMYEVNKDRSIKPLNTTFEQQAKDLADLREELDLFTLSLSKLQNAPQVTDMVKMVTGNYTEDYKKIEEKRITDITKKMKATIEDVPVKDKRTFWEKLLAGPDDKTKALFKNNLQELKSAILDFYDIEINKIDQLINKQQERVDKAEQLAEKGKVKQLQIEEERLRELQQKREKYAKRQREIDSIQIISAQGVAAAQAIKGLTESFSSSGGGIQGIVIGASWLLALGAAILSIKNAVSSSFADIPTNIEGTELVEADPRYRKFKANNNTDGYLARFDGKERIVQPDVNKDLGDFPNILLPHAVKAYKLIPTVISDLRQQSYATQNNDLKIERLEKKMDEVKKSIESIKIITKFDKDGFIQEIERDFDNVRRRKIIKG